MLIKSLIFILCYFSVCEGLNNSDLCQQVEEEFSEKVFRRSYYLTNYLEILKKLDCRYFQKECQLRTYSYTKYAELIYDQICNRDLLIKKCFQRVKESVESNKSSWDLLLPDLVNLSQTHLKDPCVQVALYDDIIIQRGYSFGEFEEMKDFFLPFCGGIWCGVDRYHRERLSPVFCASDSCSTSYTIMNVFYGISTFAISLPNLLVIVVILTSTKLRTMQNIYRTNLAFMDFLSGTIIFSTAIWISLKYVFANLQFDDLNDDLAKNFFINNFTNISVSTLISRGPKFPFKQDFMVFSGFLLIFCLVNSTYTLLMASVDRLVAVCKPLKYHIWFNVKVSTCLCALVWICSILISAYPILSDEVEYEVLYGSFIGFFARNALLIPFLMLALPFCLLWISNIATLVKIKQHQKKMKKLTPKNRRSVETKAAKTLMIMTATFTFSLMPLSIFSLVVYSSSSLDRFDKENFDIKAGKNAIIISYCCSIIFSYNSFWNFFIYQFRDKLFRKRVKEVFHGLSSSLSTYDNN